MSTDSNISKGESQSQNNFDNFIINYARAVDDIDMYISPLSTLALWHNEQSIHRAGIVLTALEMGLIKTPFVLLYTARTGDFKSAFEWLGWETLVHAIPYEGGILNIRRNYEKNTNDFFRSKYNKNKKK